MTLQAITAFFNPTGSARRVEAFETFVARLSAPLLVVELGHDGKFDLPVDAAGEVVRVEGGDVLWQKERLLDLALDALPPAVDAVAWLDGDILFERDDWPDLARAALEADALVQLFEHVHYLGPDWRPGLDPAAHVERTRPSMAKGLAEGRDAVACLTDPSPDVRPGTYANGMAWAARRELLDRHRFYDASIIGGGDRAISCAALGTFAHVRDWHELNEMQYGWYLRWAEPFHAACGGRIGGIEGDIHHLWHGSAKSRGLDSRHAGLAGFGFDPARDVAVAPEGAWRWNSEKPSMHAYVRDYFTSRETSA